MANSSAWAQACGTNGTANNVEFAIVTGATAPQQLLCARENAPQTTRQVGTITGLQNGETVLSVDYQVTGNVLLALGSTGNLYSINQATGAATLLAPLTTNGTRVTVTSPAEIDVNPAANAARIILASNATNLRVPPPIAGGVTVTDTTLSVAGAPAGSPAPQGITAAAYTNNDTDATTGTLLYAIDTAMNTLVTQTPANAGLLSTIGQLGVDVGPNTFFDIFTRLPTGNQPQNNRGLIVYQVTGQPFTLAAISLETGKTNNPRPFAMTTTPVAFAVPPTQGTTGTN